LGDTENRLGLIDALPIAVDHQTSERAWREILFLARSEGLTTYDAAYLELALRRGASLGTLDTDLAKAARDHGLTTLP
jgi:predicted nucleic acid-binding protein